MVQKIPYPTMAGVKDAAAQFSVTPAFIRKLCRNGKIRYIVISKTKWIVNLDSLAAFFNSGEPIPAAQSDPENGIRRVDQ